MSLFVDFLIQEEFLFPESGGVIGRVEITCPACGAQWELDGDALEEHAVDAIPVVDCPACGLRCRLVSE